MKSHPPSTNTPKAEHRLDPVRIVDTAENLARRINLQLPGTTLASLAAELAGLTHKMDERAIHARQPILVIRLASVVAIALALLAMSYLVRHVHARWDFRTVGELFEAADAGFNLVVLVAGAIWFFVTLEARIKRKRAVAWIQELREFIHVIDVTQLYYSPELYDHGDEDSPSARSFDYTYLLFCTEMFSVISNAAAIYARDASGDSILRAASEVEMLAAALTDKLQAKVQILRRSRNTDDGGPRDRPEN